MDYRQRELVTDFLKLQAEAIAKMDYRQRELATDFLKLQAEAIAKLEGLAQTLNPESQAIAWNEIGKIQHQIVNLQNRFSRLVYLSGEVYSNE